MVRLAKTDRLTAINIMLSAIGEAPVTSLKPATGDVALADLVLDEIDLAVQMRGWHFNVEYDVTLTRDSANKIPVPADIIRLDVRVGKYSSLEVIQRGGYLYDSKGNTDVFTTDIKVDALYFRKWDLLPEAARRYIFIRATRVFQDRVQGAEAHHTYSKEDELEALADLQKEEAATADHNWLGSLDWTWVTRRRSAMPRSPIHQGRSGQIGV